MFLSSWPWLAFLARRGPRVSDAAGPGYRHSDGSRLRPGGLPAGAPIQPRDRAPATWPKPVLPLAGCLRRAPRGSAPPSRTAHAFAPLAPLPRTALRPSSLPARPARHPTSGLPQSPRPSHVTAPIAGISASAFGTSSPVPDRLSRGAVGQMADLIVWCSWAVLSPESIQRPQRMTTRPIPLLPQLPYALGYLESCRPQTDQQKAQPVPG